MTSYDPLAQVVDAPIAVNQFMMDRLREFREGPRLQYLPGVDVHVEKERLSKVLIELVDILDRFLLKYPTKAWVMEQFQRALVEVRYEETEGREHFGMELEQLMDILGIESSDGLINYYLVGV